MQVHKETIDKVPNSLPTRGNIEIEIYGMEGIPDADLKAHENAKNNEDDDEPSAKRAKSDSPALMGQPMAGTDFYILDTSKLHHISVLLSQCLSVSLS